GRRGEARGLPRGLPDREQAAAQPSERVGLPRHHHHDYPGERPRQPVHVAQLPREQLAEARPALERPRELEPVELEAQAVEPVALDRERGADAELAGLEPALLAHGRQRIARDTALAIFLVPRGAQLFEQAPPRLQTRLRIDRRAREHAAALECPERPRRPRAALAGIVEAGHEL